MPKVTATFQQPIQTNDWWTSLLWNHTQNQTFLWEMHSWRLYAHPLCMHALRYGMKVYYPTELSIINQFGLSEGAYRYNMDIYDFLLGVTGLDLGTQYEVKVDSYSDWAVTAVWEDGNGDQLEATMAHGSPYIYCKKQGGDALVRPLFNRTITHDLGHILGFTTNGHHYGIFAPTGADWRDSIYTIDENELVSNPANSFTRTCFVSNLDGKDYFSIALLPDSSLSTLLDYAQYAYAFIEDTEVSWVYEDSSAMLHSTFSVTTQPQEGTETHTLMALYRHQWLRTNEVNTSYTYTSARGEMKVREGNAFTTHIPHKGIIPYLPWHGTYDSLALYSYIEDERQVTNVFSGPFDSYWDGKRMSRQADLIQIADQVGHSAARDHLLTVLKTRVEDWLMADNGESNTGYFYYDSNWNTLIGFESSYGSDTRMNDHHFHYAYLIKAAATIAQFDTAWAAPNQWGGMVEWVIRDAANWERGHSHFPFLRTFDAYAGHSWANGHGNSFWGNDQESSSESMNLAASIFFWGLNTCNDTLQDLGLFLYLTEAEAIEQYWFDVDNAVFPNAFPYQAAIRIWGNGAERVSGNHWFEQEPEYILGINLLPLDGGSLYLARSPNWVERYYLEMESQNGGPADNLWQDMMWMYESMYDAPSALSRYIVATTPIPYQTNLPYVPNVSNIYAPHSGDAISPAQLYHWIHSFNELGHVDTTLSADYPAVMVFSKAGQRTYVSYNPPLAETRTIRFSDGVQIQVAPGECKVWKEEEWQALLHRAATSRKQ